MPKPKTKEITITQSKGAFFIFKKPKTPKKGCDFANILSLRQLLSNEKARILHIIKSEKPKSIYELAKKLNRGFKSVSDDVKLLEKFGVVKLIVEKTKNRIRHKPEVVVDVVTINLKV